MIRNLYHDYMRLNQRLFPVVNPDIPGNQSSKRRFAPCVHKQKPTLLAAQASRKLDRKTRLLNSRE